MFRIRVLINTKILWSFMSSIYFWGTTDCTSQYKLNYLSIPITFLEINYTLFDVSDPIILEADPMKASPGLVQLVCMAGSGGREDQGFEGRHCGEIFRRLGTIITSSSSRSSWNLGPSLTFHHERKIPIKLTSVLPDLNLSIGSI
jgi:hypothetical protein